MLVYHAGINKYNFLINTDLNIKEFSEMTEEWLEFIISCRAGKTHEYDIVIGAMANDQVYNYISDYLSGMPSNRFSEKAKDRQMLCFFCNVLTLDFV